MDEMGSMIFMGDSDYQIRESRYPSYIDRNHYGCCLRAAQNVPKDTIVASLYVIKTNKSYSAQHASKSFKHVALIGIKNGVPLWGRVKGKWAYCNHSCEPNCRINNHFQIVTYQKVRKGQELTIAYDAYIPGLPWNERWNFKCLCRSKKCKKIINKYRMDIIYPIT